MKTLTLEEKIIIQDQYQRLEQERANAKMNTYDFTIQEFTKILKYKQRGLITTKEYKRLRCLLEKAYIL